MESENLDIARFKWCWHESCEQNLVITHKYPALPAWMHEAPAKSKKGGRKMTPTKNRWYLLIAMFIINLCVGSAYAWSVFQKPLISLFQWSTSDTSLAFSISLFVIPLAMIVGGRIQSQRGPKFLMFTGGIIFSSGIIAAGFTHSLLFLYMTYGVMSGFGIGFIYGTGISNAVKWFPDKRGLAAGLVAAGFALGAVINAPIANMLVLEYGVLKTFQFLGVAYLVVTVISAQFVSAPPAGYAPAGWVAPVAGVAGAPRDKEWTEMVRDPLFYVLWLMYTIACVSGLMIIGHASPIGQEVIKLDAVTAAFAVSMMALANTAGRVLWGISSDRLGQYPTLVTMFVLSAVMMAMLNYVHSLTPFVLVISVIAACFGGFFAIFPSITADLFGAKNLSMNYGILFTSYGVAAFIGPRLAARVKEINNGDYTVAFVTAAMMCVVAVLLTFFARWKAKRLRL